jgi:hypothetical protein
MTRSSRRSRSSSSPRPRRTNPSRRRHVRRRHRRLSAPPSRVDRALDLLRHVVTVAGVLGVAYFLSDAVAALAGETTAAEIAFRFLANIRLSEALAWLFGTSGIGFGYLQLWLRERARRELRSALRRMQRRQEANPSKGEPR